MTPMEIVISAVVGNKSVDRGMILSRNFPQLCEIVTYLRPLFKMMVVVVVVIVMTHCNNSSSLVKFGFFHRTPCLTE